MKLLKRLNTAPSWFQISSQRFGGSGLSSKKEEDNKKPTKKKSSGGFQGATGFKNAYKKFGGS